MNNTILLTVAMTAIVLQACQRGEGYDASGIFEATTVTISAETPGRILCLDVNEGDSLALGSRVAVIDTATLALQLKQLEAQRRCAEGVAPDVAAQAASLRHEIEHQERECERFEGLLADGAATQKQCDDARARLSVLRGQLTALLSTLGKNRSTAADNALALHYQWEQVREQLAKSVIASPLSGIVIDKYAEPGEFATPGRQLCRVADMDHVYIRAYFTAEQLAHISVGQEVTVIADYGGDEQREFPGRITWIAQESEFTPKSIQTRQSRSNLVYAVKVAVDGTGDGSLKLGQYGGVRL